MNDDVAFLCLQLFGKLVNITQDPVKGTIWAFTEKAVFRYKVCREERNVWQVRVIRTQTVMRNSREGAVVT
jgi:transcription initiation factor IIE alpha subunit